MLVEDSVNGAVIISLIDFVLSFVFIAGIGVVLSFFPLLNKLGSLSVDTDKMLIHLDGSEVHVTPIEFRILEHLARNRGKVLTHDMIMKKVWGPFFSDTRTLRVNMANIRRKIEKNPAEPRYIRTEIGVGYRMLEE